MPTAGSRELLERIDAQLERVLLQRQHPISGLMPASTAHTVHGNYGDAWVRDGVYTIQAVWGLAIAWRRQGGNARRIFELEQSVLALMRGQLRSMMGQAAKVDSASTMAATWAICSAKCLAVVVRVAVVAANAVAHNVVPMLKLH